MVVLETPDSLLSYFWHTTKRANRVEMKTVSCAINYKLLVKSGTTWFYPRSQPVRRLLFSER